MNGRLMTVHGKRSMRNWTSPRIVESGKRV
jgi:hypothetical protein